SSAGWRKKRSPRPPASPSETSAATGRKRGRSCTARLSAGRQGDTDVSDAADCGRWDAVCAILGVALDMDATARAAYLDGAGAADPRLRAEVESLLAGGAAADDFLATSAVARMAPLVVNATIDRERLPAAEACLGVYRLVRELGEGG